MRRVAANVHSVENGMTKRAGKIAGVVLAGGQSSRMGQNKALLQYEGRTLLEHMVDTLRAAGAADVFVSGSYEGYDCIPDQEQYAGPAVALRHVLQNLAERKTYQGALCVPVDMPRLSAEALRHLCGIKYGAYFAEHPLPLYVPLPLRGEAGAESMRGFLAAENIAAQALPEKYADDMLNANTPEEWKKVAAK